MMPQKPEGRVEALNGVELYDEVYGAGEPLLLLHGFTGSSQDWTRVIEEWRADFQLIVPDLRGHGRSGILSKPFRHRDAAADLIALLDRLNARRCRGLGVSGGGNVLLHVAAMQPDRIRAMVLVSATPYFPAGARAIMSQYAAGLSEEQRELLRKRHSGGEAQIQALPTAHRPSPAATTI